MALEGFPVSPLTNLSITIVKTEMSSPFSSRALVAIALGGMLGLSTIGSVAAGTTRDEECRLLERQLRHELLVTHAKARRAAEARALQVKATKLCASVNQAQGIRTFADALKLLGVQPIDEDRPSRKVRKPNGESK